MELAVDANPRLERRQKEAQGVVARGYLNRRAGDAAFAQIVFVGVVSTRPPLSGRRCSRPTYTGSPMAEVSLVAEAGRPTGSAAARRLRALGKVPAVLYGHGIEPQPLTVDRKVLRAALAHEAGLNALFALEVGGERHLAMARQLQRDALKRSVSHVDFVIVRRDEIVTVEVPVRLVGEALEVEHADGMVEQQIFHLEINAKPADIPSSIEVDISGLEIGGAIRVGELKLPEGVTTDVDDEDAVVMGQTTRLEVEEEAEEAVEGDEAASPGGDTED